MITIEEAITDDEWQQGCKVLHDVYIGEGFTAAEAAQRMQTRENMEDAGVFLLAKNEQGAVAGAVLMLHVGSGLQQIARPGEREFRMLAVSVEARREGAGEALVNACIQRAQAAEATALVLWTQPIMHAAQRLYERLGFARDSSRDVPDPRGWTRMVYVRSLR